MPRSREIKGKGEWLSSRSKKILAMAILGTILSMTTDSEGRALANEPVSVHLVTDNGTELLYKGVTGEDGSCQPVIRPPPINDSAVFEIRAGKEIVRRTIRIEDTIKIMISTDKPIYQPGQTVHIRTLAFEGMPAHASGRLVTLEIDSPSGDVIFREEYEANEFGIASMDFPLAKILPLGYYKITAFVGTETQSASFLVKRYVLPKFKIEVQDLKSWYTVNENIDATISCQYFFGKVVEGTVSVTASTYYGYWQEVYRDTGALINGELDLNIPRTEYAVGLPFNSNNGYLAINITVVDEAGHAEQKSVHVSVARDPIIITAISDLNMLGMESTYHIIARYPDGIPVPHATVRWGFDHTQNQMTTTDERGVAVLDFEYRSQTSLTITVQKDDLSTTEYLPLRQHQGIKIIGSQSRYEIGRTASFEVYYSGEAMTSLAYYEVVSKGFVLKTDRLRLVDDRASIEFPVTASMVPLCEVRVFKVQEDLTITGDKVMFGVGAIASLDVDVTVSEDTFKPRDEVVIDFLVSEDGAGVASALGISIVDQAVFEINARYEGFENLMFEMDADFATPQYQILDYIYTNKDIRALPTNTTVEIEMTTGKDSTVTSTWAINLANAMELKTAAVDGYWLVLTLLLVVGYFGLIAIGYKRRALAAMGIGFVIVVPGFMGMYVMSMGMAGTGGVLGPDDQWGGEFDGLEGGAALDAPAADNFVFGLVFEDDSGRDKTNMGAPSNGSSSPTLVRNYFPETWYWNPSIITDQNGEASLTLQAPDSITAWNVEATASTKDARFGLGTGNVTVFQDFFIEPDIPVSVIRGDEFPMKILVYNYLNASSNVSVLLGFDDWYNTTSSLVKTVTIGPNTVGSVDFPIRADIVGWHEVNVMASTNALSDAVTRRIYVEPDGKEIITTYAGQLEDDDVANVTFELDPQAIQFSTGAFVKLEAGMDSVVLEGAEKYIHFVSGCGEQSMSTLAVNILAFDVMEKTSADLDLMEYEMMVTQGIQHELTFLLEAQNGAGRGIVWFPSDRDVHPWLTSWGLITFMDAKIAGFTIDSAIITDMQDWLVSQQESDGSYKFPDWGIYETNNPILQSKKLATTAYITRALLYSGYDPTSSPVSKAVDYISDNREEAWDDPYTLALCLIVLENAGVSSSLQAEMAVQLDSLKTAENGTYYWASDMNMISDSSYRYYGRCNARVIETTAYAMMAINEQSGYLDTVSGAREYLLAHRSSLGGFFSTQDTVVALQSLRSVSSRSMGTMDIQIIIEDEVIQTVHFNEDNAHLAVFVDLHDHLNETALNEIRLQSSGSGRVYYTVTKSQYLPWWVVGVERPQELDLKVTYDSTDIKVDDTITAHLTMEYLGSAGMLKMILIDVRAPAGFVFVVEDLNTLVEEGKISSFELADRQALLYVTDVMPNQTLSLDYHLRATMPLKGTIQGVKAFDMYDPDLTVEVEPVDVRVTEP